MKSTLRIARWLLVVVCFALMLPALTQAQELRGKIIGRVTDPNGAAVPGAAVQVVDVGKDKATTLTTNSDGIFEAPYLLPGAYKILVEASGFKKALQENVSVAINQTTNLEIKLDVGTPQETVTVTTEAAQLNTNDSNLGQTIDRKRVDELPSVHGDPYYLINLTPGVAYTGSTRLDRPFEPTHIANFAMGGARGIRSDLLIDGAPSTATANAFEVIASYVPPTDATQEFRVQTSTYDAQFGNTEGGVTSIVTKGGTNDFHGTAYYWTEPGGMTANDFFGNAKGLARPYTYSNRPGFSIGGPVWIPKLYNGKNKTFFFVSYESINDARPRFDATNIWAPTAALANGDFSAFLPSNCASPGAGQICIFDPLSGTYNAATGAVTNRAPFAGNIIPLGRINPVARAVLPFLGGPKGAPQAGSRITGNINDSTLTEILNPPYRTNTTRIDQNIGDKDRLFGRYSWYNRNSSYNNYTGTIYVGDRFAFISKQAVVDEVHTFDANNVLNLRYGFNRFIRAPDAPEGQYGMDLTSLGFPAAFNNAIGEGVRRFPRFDFTCQGCTGTTVGNGHTNEFRPVGSHFVTAVLNRTMGIQSMRFGGEMRIYREDDSFKNNNQSGQFSFNNQFTRVGSATSNDLEGLQAFAAFLLGYPSTMSITRASDYSEYSKTWGFFVQDDLRLTRKLTLNLGLRYEFEQPMVERQNKSVSGFDISYVQPFQGQAQANYTNTGRIPATDVLKTTYGLTNITAQGGLLFVGKDTDSLYETPKNGFLPRVGFAYAWNDKTVLRGGFGLYQGFLGERRGDVFQPGYTQVTNEPLTAIPTGFGAATGAPIPVLISNPFPSGITEPSGNALGKQTALGQTITFFNQNPGVAKQMRWSLGVQRELWGGWVVQLDYVGDHGYDIEINRNLNAQPLNTLNSDNSVTTAMALNNFNLGGTVSNPFCNTIVSGNCTSAQYVGVGATISRRTLLSPFPEFGSITTTNNDGKSWYHSAQISVDKRFSKGYGLNFAYTRSKWIEALEYLNAADAKPVREIGAQDVPNRFSLSSFYEFPFGKGQPFLSHANWLVNAIVGGWQIEGTYVYQSGFPLRFANDAFYLGGKIGLDKSQQTLGRWFNTSAFISVIGGNPSCKDRTGATITNSSCATPVDHLRTLPFFFNDVRIDPINNADLGLRKDIRIREGMKVQLRMEFINAFNHPLFPGANVSPSSTAFGTVSASNQLNYARRAQLMAKFIF